MRKNNNWILIILVVLLIVFGIYMIWGRGKSTRDSYTPEGSRNNFENSKSNKASTESDVELIASDNEVGMNNEVEDIEIIPSDNEVGPYNEVGSHSDIEFY